MSEDWKIRLENILGFITDGPRKKSLFGRSEAQYQHVHQPALCYPTLAAGVQVVTGAGAWELGAITQVIPANAIDHAYDIHWVNFEGASANGSYELHLFKGAPGQEELIAKIRTTRDSNQSGAPNVPVQVPVLPSNTRITARVASNAGGRNVTVSMFYHSYINYSD